MGVPKTICIVQWQAFMGVLFIKVKIGVQLVYCHIAKRAPKGIGVVVRGQLRVSEIG
jgi:hypothetical protein